MIHFFFVFISVLKYLCRRFYKIVFNSALTTIMKHYVRTIISLLLLAIGSFSATAQNTVRIDATKKHQHITGFGGFVCSPQFQYNHMTTTEIKKVWGATSTVGCNIMRLYIPIGRNAWSQSLATAKQAKQMGLIVFASHPGDNLQSGKPTALAMPRTRTERRVS